MSFAIFSTLTLSLLSFSYNRAYIKG